MIRDTMVDAALAVVGFGAARANADQYADLIAAGETDRARAGLLKASDCGLVVRGLWRRVGLVDPRLEAPYVVGSVMATIRNMALEAGAWRGAELVSGGEYAPEEGDVFWIGEGDHVATLTRIVSSDTTDVDYKWFSVDGGQRDTSGAEVILNRVRACKVDGAGMLVLDGLAAVRPLVGVIDLEALAAKFGGAF